MGNLGSPGTLRSQARHSASGRNAGDLGQGDKDGGGEGLELHGNLLATGGLGTLLLYRSEQVMETKDTISKKVQSVLGSHDLSKSNFPHCSIFLRSLLPMNLFLMHVQLQPWLIHFFGVPRMTVLGDNPGIPW